MFQNIIICDRCGEKANSCGTSYYTINIFAHDINPTKDGRVYADTAVQNVHENMNNILGREVIIVESVKRK